MMTQWLRITAAVACLAFGATSAQAVQVYALYGKGCTVTAGAIVHVDDDIVSVLEFDGDVKRIATASIELIGRYDVLENPFPHISSGTSGPPMLTVSSESNEGTFRAYASDFFEDLVLFLDDAGKIRVVQMSEIVSIVHRPDELSKKKRPLKSLPFRSIKLVSPPGRSTCPGIVSAEMRDKAPVDRVATLVMADKLRIDSFWSGMRRGYRDLESLRERTLFYARPLMFDQKTRLGITAVKSNRAEVLKLADLPWDVIPMYLEFGSGAAYRFQSASSIGNKSWRMVPDVKPTGAWRSEFKSHLLHGMFLANLSGFTAGRQLYGESWNSNPEAHRHSVWMTSSFNHLTLLGVDYGAWSISYGYYFPDFAMGQLNEFREFTSTKTSNVFRLGYQPSPWQVELYLFNTDMDAEGVAKGDAKSDYDVSPPYGSAGDTLKFYSLRNLPETAHITSTTARLNFALTLRRDIVAGTDVSFTNTRYREEGVSFALTDNANSNVKDVALGGPVINKIARTLWGSRTHVRMDLGQWVALSAEAIIEYAKVDGGFSGIDASSHAVDKINTYVATMELLL